MMSQVYRRLIGAIHRDDEYQLNRRAFLHIMFLGSVALGMAAIPVASMARWAERMGPKRSPEPLGTPIAKVADLAPGEALDFNWPTARDPAVLIHLPEGGFVAYDRRCTHLLCPVLWDKAQGHLLCPCHGGHFNASTGAVLSGPPRRPLPPIELIVSDGVVRVLGSHPRGVKTDAT